MSKSRKRTPVVSDYASAAYPKTQTTKRDQEHTLSFRCRDCSTLRYVLPKELDRAAKPRCLKCGGTLLETKQTSKRRLEQQDSQRVSRFSSREISPVTTGFRCKSCRRKFSNVEALESHLQLAGECLKHYLNKGCLQTFQGKLILADTIDIRWFRSTKEYIVRAIFPGGHRLPLASHSSKEHCYNLVREALSQQ